MNNQVRIHPDRELALLRQTSHTVANATGFSEILEAFAAELSAAGIAGWTIRMDEAGPEWDQGEQHWGQNNKITVAAPVGAQGRVWGEIELDSEATGIARFLGQQLGLWLWRRELTEENKALALSRQWMEEQIATDKAVARAKALLSKTRRISPSEAEKAIRQHSLQSGRDLRQIAEALMTANSKTLVQGNPRFAHLTPRWQKSA